MYTNPNETSTLFLSRVWINSSLRFRRYRLPSYSSNLRTLQPCDLTYTIHLVLSSRPPLQDVLPGLLWGESFRYSLILYPVSLPDRRHLISNPFLYDNVLTRVTILSSTTSGTTTGNEQSSFLPWQNQTSMTIMFLWYLTHWICCL